MKALILLAALAAGAAEPRWRQSLDEASAAARASGGSLLIDFQAPWCYSCYYMERHVLSGEAFASAARGLALLKLDVDREDGRALKKKYRVSFLPTYVLADREGRELGRIVGEQTEADFVKKLRALMGPADSGTGRALAALRGALAAGDLAAASRAAAPGKKDIAALADSKEWRVLSARLALRRGGHG